MDFTLTVADLVDIAGIAGFVLSLLLAISQIWSSRLRIDADSGVFIQTSLFPESIFLDVILYNKTSLPFSLIQIQIDSGKGYRNMPIEKTVRTYQGHESKDRLAVKPVVLSREFPVKFDSYAAEEFFLEVSHLHINPLLLHPGEATHNPTGRLRTLFHRIRKLCTPPPRLRLVLHTSRGRRVVSIPVTPFQDWDWLETYAVRKAGHAGLIVFPPC